MAGWKINPQQLKQELTAVLGEEPDQAMLEQAGYLADRISREHGNAPVLSQSELIAAARGALFAVQQGRSHYLNLPDKRMTSALLSALDKLVNPSAGDQAPAQAELASQDNWPDFLTRFVEGKDVGMAATLHGAAQYGKMLGTIFGRDLLYRGALTLAGQADRIKRPANLVGRGETVDIPFNIILKQALLVYGEMHHPSVKAHARITNQMAVRGLPKPPTTQEVQAFVELIQGRFQEGMSDAALLTLMKQDSELEQAVLGLFSYQTAFSRTTLSHQASDTLLYYKAGLYDLRAAAPLGKISSLMPEVDLDDRESVIGFMRKGLNIKFENKDQEEAVWKIFRYTIDNITDIHASEILMDLDKNMYFWFMKDEGSTVKGFIRGVDHIRARSTWIMALAMVMRDRSTLSFCTHSIMSRVADNFNHPDLAVFNFIFTGRLPGDPRVTTEELEASEDHMGFESLSEASGSVLDKLLHTPIENWDWDVIKQELAIRQHKAELVRGVKTITTLQAGGKRKLQNTRMILFDDTAAQVTVWRLAGGRAIQMARTPTHDLVPPWVALKNLQDHDASLGPLLPQAGESQELTDSLPAVGAIVNHGPKFRWQYNAWGWLVHMAYLGHIKAQGAWALRKAIKNLLGEAGKKLTLDDAVDQIIAQKRREVLLQESPLIIDGAELQDEDDAQAQDAPVQTNPVPVINPGRSAVRHHLVKLGVVLSAALPSDRSVMAHVIKPIPAAHAQGHSIPAFATPKPRLAAFNNMVRHAPAGYGLMMPKPFQAMRLAGR